MSTKLPPYIFNVPFSCLPTPKPPPRKEKSEFSQQSYFDNTDRIDLFADFQPEKALLKKYPKALIFRSKQKITIIFMNESETQSEIVITVQDKQTLCSPASVVVFKKGVRVPIPQNLINPNNGFARYSQLFEIVNFAVQYQLQTNSVLSNICGDLEKLVSSNSLDEDKCRKITFITRQIKLLESKKFSMADYCFAVQSYPQCRYEKLQDFLVLPCVRKIKSIFSATDVNEVCAGMFSKVKCSEQRYCMLLIDEVSIRPTIAYSHGMLNGFSINNPNEKATSILAVMAKCLHGGPSLMVSVTPVNKLTADFQFDVVVKAAAAVEKCGGIVIGSITDNNKVNQHFCSKFLKVSNSKASHPLDSERSWFLLYDTVHLFKSLRNNWITEKTKTLTFDGTTVGSFKDIQDLYENEQSNILKTTPLTRSSVYPSRLQLQNVQHVIRVMNDQVVAALKINGKEETAQVIEQILRFWKVVNVKSCYEQSRFNDPDRCVQSPDSTSLQQLHSLFFNSASGLQFSM